MQGFAHFFLALVISMAIICTAGCIQSPGQVAQDTKEVLNNTSLINPSIVPVEAIQPTFAPVTPSRATITKSTPAPIRTQVSNDPIVGQWTLNGQSGYSCYIAAYPDGTGRADCNSFLVPVATKSFHWVNEGVDANQSFMTDYNITEDNGGNYHHAQYSSISGSLYSSMLPANTYLTKQR